MTGDQNPTTDGSGRDHRANGERRSAGEEAASFRELVRLLLDRLDVSVQSGPDSADRLPEYHDSWYRNGTMREEVQATVEGQVTWLHEIDDKAMRTLRFNAILLGLVVPAFSFAVKFGLVGGADAFYNGHVAVGIAALVSSTMLAGLTYTSSSLDGGVSRDDVREAKRRGLTDEEVHDTFVSSYAEWIQANRRTIYWNAIFVTFTIILTVAAFVFLSLGVADAILNGVPRVIQYTAYIGLLVVAVVSQFF